MLTHADACQILAGNPTTATYGFLPGGMYIPDGHQTGWWNSGAVGKYWTSDLYPNNAGFASDLQIGPTNYCTNANYFRYAVPIRCVMDQE